jgi:hypothetical protein
VDGFFQTPVEETGNFVVELPFVVNLRMYLECLLKTEN